MRQAEASLVGAAELWFESMGGDAYESWDDFEVEIRQRFQEDYFNERLEEELRTIRQRQGESVTAYAERFCSARLYSTDVYQTIFRTRTLAHNSETPPPQRKVYNSRSQQKQGARFTRVHIYNQM